MVNKMLEVLLSIVLILIVLMVIGLFVKAFSGPAEITHYCQLCNHSYSSYEEAEICTYSHFDEDV